MIFIRPLKVPWALEVPPKGLLFSTELPAMGGRHPPVFLIRGTRHMIDDGDDDSGDEPTKCRKEVMYF